FVVPLAPTFITLPTGDQALATHSGTVLLPCGLSLHNVLHVPRFTFNLLSVICLAIHSQISVTFSAEQCRIQALESQRMIGLAHEHKDLAILHLLDSNSFIVVFPL
ncbi:hypothetical protein LINGRAHAP2_LOCUS20154, partial [Linum grandiflorum]